MSFVWVGHGSCQRRGFVNSLWPFGHIGHNQLLGLFNASSLVFRELPKRFKVMDLVSRLSTNLAFVVSLV